MPPSSPFASIPILRRARLWGPFPRDSKQLEPQNGLPSATKEGLGLVLSANSHLAGGTQRWLTGAVQACRLNTAHDVRSLYLMRKNRPLEDAEKHLHVTPDIVEE